MRTHWRAPDGGGNWSCSCGSSHGAVKIQRNGSSRCANFPGKSPVRTSALSMAARSKGGAAAPKAGASSDSWLSELKTIRTRLQTLKVAPAPAEDGGDSDDEFALIMLHIEEAPQAAATGTGIANRPATDADLLTASVHRALAAVRSSAAAALTVAAEAFLWRDGPRAWMAVFADRVQQEADTPARTPPSFHQPSEWKKIL